MKFDFKLPEGWSWRQRPDIDGYQFYMTDDTSVCFDVSGAMLNRIESDPAGVIGSIRGQMDNAKLAAMARAIAPRLTERARTIRDEAITDHTFRRITETNQFSLAELLKRERDIKEAAIKAGGGPVLVDRLPPELDTRQLRRIREMEAQRKRRQRALCCWKKTDLTQFSGLGGLMPCKTCGNPIAENFDPDNCKGEPEPPF